MEGRPHEARSTEPDQRRRREPHGRGANSCEHSPKRQPLFTKLGLELVGSSTALDHDCLCDPDVLLQWWIQNTQPYPSIERGLTSWWRANARRFPIDFVLAALAVANNGYVGECY